MHVEPGQDRGAARRAERGRDKRVAEMSASREQTIDVRGVALQPGMAQRSDKIVPVIVGKYEDDVTASGLAEQRRRRGCAVRYRVRDQRSSLRRHPQGRGGAQMRPHRHDLARPQGLGRRAAGQRDT